MTYKILKVPVKKSLNPHFIGLFISEDTRVCDGVISFFEDNVESHNEIGFFNYEEKKIDYDSSVIDGKNMTISLSNVNNDDHVSIRNYFLYLGECLKSYGNIYNAFDVNNLGVSVNNNITRLNKSSVDNNRYNYHRKQPEQGMDVFYFKTYLNSLDSGAETEFKFQGTSINHIKGLTLICPTDWTHSFRVLNKNSSKDLSYSISGTISYSEVKGQKIGMSFDDIKKDK